MLAVAKSATAPTQKPTMACWDKRNFHMSNGGALPLAAMQLPVRTTQQMIYFLGMPASSWSLGVGLPDTQHHSAQGKGPAME